MIHDTAFTGLAPAEPVHIRRAFRNVMLIGFDAETFVAIATVLHRVPLVPQTYSEPYTALQALAEDPGQWMACIVNAGIFSDDMPLDRYMRLLGHQGPPCGVILGNAARGTGLGDPLDAQHATLCDVNDTASLDRAIRLVLQRRGFLCPRPIRLRVPAQMPDPDLQPLPTSVLRRGDAAQPYQLTANMRCEHGVSAALVLGHGQVA